MYFQSESNEIEAIVLFESIFCGFWALMLVFAACEIGQRFTNLYNEINNEICLIDWYLPSIEIQRMLLTILMYTQQPVEITFFGSMSCTRAQFKRVS